MRKVNLERKIDLALKELIDAYRLGFIEDPEVQLNIVKYHLNNAISYLCMLDDYVVEEKSTYYCLSEIERNVNYYLEERKRRKNENGD